MSRCEDVKQEILIILLFQLFACLIFVYSGPENTQTKGSVLGQPRVTVTAMASVNKRGPVSLKPDAGGFGEKHRCQEQEGAFASFTGSRDETPAVRGRQCHLGSDGLQQIDVGPWFFWG